MVGKRSTDSDSAIPLGMNRTGYINGVPVTIEVASIGGAFVLRSDAAAAFLRMQDAYGASFVIESAFRSNEEQKYLYNLYLSGKGNLAARPGYSNHQGGISVDISTGGLGVSSAVYQWLHANARKYGFRNEVPTEPWHWSYLQ